MSSASALPPHVLGSRTARGARLLARCEGRVIGAPREGRADLRAALLHAEARYAARRGGRVGGEAPRTHEALARRPCRRRRVRPRQWLRTHLGLLEPRSARPSAGRRQAEGRLASAGRARAASDAGEQDPAASLFLAAPVGALARALGLPGAACHLGSQARAQGNLACERWWANVIVPALRGRSV